MTFFCAWRDFKKTFCGISTYHKWMLKLQISSIFNFDRAHRRWISGVLGVNQFRTRSINFEHIYVLNIFCTWSKWDFSQQKLEHIQIGSILFEKYCMNSNFLVQNCSIYVHTFQNENINAKKVQIPCNGSKLKLCPLWQNWKIDKMVLLSLWLDFENSFSQKT